jgi:hypothetical protein
MVPFFNVILRLEVQGIEYAKIQTSGRQRGVVTLNNRSYYLVFEDNGRGRPCDEH